MLIQASKDSNFEKIVESLKKGADVNSMDKNDWNPLIWAANKGNFKIVRYIARRGGINYYCSNKYI